MNTRITIPIADGGGGSTQYVLDEAYDEVLERMHPESPPSSALEARRRAQFRKADGGRLALSNVGMIAVAEEVDE